MSQAPRCEHGKPERGVFCARCHPGHERREFMTIPDIEKQLHAQEERLNEQLANIEQLRKDLAELRKQLGVPSPCLVDCGEKRPQFTR